MFNFNEKSAILYENNDGNDINLCIDMIKKEINNECINGNFDNNNYN